VATSLVNLRAVVLVSGSGRSLQNLIDLSRAHALPLDVVLVVGSKHGIRALDRAVAADIPTAVIDRKNFDAVEGFSESIFRLATGYRADLVLLAGWLSLLAIPRPYLGRVMNIHPALLPKFGGKGMYGHHVHAAVLAAGETESGCTVHFVNNEYDAGPPILQRRCPVLPTDTPESLADRVFAEELLAYPEAIRAFAEGRARMPQTRI
jgi:formyltetrahydrofolate-dependent phosphoribosylglycinamide formyltransferase